MKSLSPVVTVLVIALGTIILLARCAERQEVQPVRSSVHQAPASLPAATSTVPGKTGTPHVIVPGSTPIQHTKESVWEQREHWAPANQIRVMLIDSSGNLWAGGPAGLVQWNQKTKKPVVYVVREEPEESKVVALAQTHDQALWIGTFGNGISRLDEMGQWQIYTVEDGLPSNFISSLVSTPDGLLWVDTSAYAQDQAPSSGGHLGKFDGSRWTPGIGGGFDKMVTAPDGVLWSVTGFQIGQYRGSSVGFFNGSTWKTTDFDKENDFATAITVAPDGVVWVAARTGVFRLEGSTLHKIIPPWIGKTDANVSSIEVTKDGFAWFGFSVGAGVFGDGCGDRVTNIEEVGVYRFDGQNWSHFSDENGLVDNKICDITTGLDGSIFFGSFDKGISQFDGQNWVSYRIQ